MHITRTIRTIIAFENGVIFYPHVETTQLFQMSKRTVKYSAMRTVL